MDDRRIPFSQEDEERIASAGVWGMIAAITSIASTLLGVVVPLAVIGVSALGWKVIALGVNVILAVWLLQASSAFRKVALTDEADQQYLLLGFTKLRNYFMMTGILIIAAITLVVLAIVGVMTCGSSMLRHF
jgi:hypothetical protein